MRSSAAAGGRITRALAVALLFVAIGAFLLRGAFVDFENLGAKDWNAFSGQAQAEITSIERDGEFPLWNPWRHGGQVSFAQPESMFLSPITPTALATGVIPAFKLWLVPIWLFGCLGAWLLAGALGLSGVARFVPPLLFFTSGAFPYYVAGGLPNWLFGIALYPWLLWCRRRAAEDHRFVLFGALAFAGVLFCGSIYQFVFFPLVLGLDALLESVATWRPRPLADAAAILVAGAALSLVRLLPIAEVYRAYPRELPADVRHLDLALIARAFLDPSHPDLESIQGTVLVDGQNWISWVTVGCYVGPCFAALAVLGFVREARRSWPLFVCFAFLAWMALGSGVTPSAWDLVHRLPVLKSMQAPERLIVPSSLFVALAAGFGAAAIARFSKKLALAALLVSAAFPIVVNDDVAFAAFPERPSARPAAPGEFVQMLQPVRKTQWGGELYEAVLRNRGNPNAQADVPTPEAVQSVGEPGYRGEAWLASGRGTVSARFTANTVRVTAELEHDDTLVVNQNFFPGWEASGTHAAPCIQRNGLIAVELPKGNHAIELRFRQPSVRLGALLSTLALVAMIGAWFVRRHRGGPKNGFGAPEISALTICTALLGALGLGRDSERASSPKTIAATSASGPRAVDPAGFAAALAEARPGDVLTLKDGDYAGFVLDKGVSVVAEHPGRARLASGTIAIANVPAGPGAALVGLSATSEGAAITVSGCAAGVVLQSLDFADASGADGVAIAVDHSDSVLLVGSRTGCVRADSATLAVSRCDIAAPPSRAAGPAVATLRVTSGSALLGDVTLSARDAPAIAADRGRIDLACDREGAISAGAAHPLARLSNGSWLRGSGLGAPPIGSPRVEKDATSRHGTFSPALPRVRLLDAPAANGRLAVELTGAPGARGALVIGARMQLITVPGTRQFVQLGRDAPDITIPIEMPADGRLVLESSAEAVGLAGGMPVVLQLLLRSPPPPGRMIWSGMRTSPIEGALIVP